MRLPARLRPPSRSVLSWPLASRLLSFLAAFAPAACAVPGEATEIDPAEPDLAEGLFALGTAEQCSSLVADSSYPGGDPHLYVSSQSYTRQGCTDAYLVDVTYKALSPLPGTYLSWADDEPTNEGGCTAARLRMIVWDTTTTPHVFKGSLVSQGVWGANPDPAANPDVTHLCQIDPIRAEGSISFTPGRKYRFALRAAVERSGIHERRFVFANAPLPGRKGIGAQGGFVEGRYMTVLASAGADMGSYNPWPTSTFQVRLTSMNARVARGGDLMFQGGFFFRPALSYSKLGYPNFGMSSANLLYMGKDLALNAFTCPWYEPVPNTGTPPEYTYPIEGYAPYIEAGRAYCLLNARNTEIDRVKVVRADPGASKLILIGFGFDKLTNKSTWGCLDGFCDAEVKIAAHDTRSTPEEQAMVAMTFDLLHDAKSCIEGELQRALPVPLGMDLHGASAGAPFLNGGSLFGKATDVITSFGFQGHVKPGDHRVEALEDLRFDLHETMHVYNGHLFPYATLPSWFDEGMAIQLAKRASCGGDPRLIKDGWRNWEPGTTAAHSLGSELFRRLEIQHACDLACANDIWRALHDAHGDDPVITTAEIKSVMEAYIGADLSALYTAVGIPY